LPEPTPERDRVCYFLGAGFSSAFDLPNTTVLLTRVHALARKHSMPLERHLKDAYKFFYPEESASFIPEVVDFFSVLRAYEEVGKGVPGAFEHPALLTDLKMAIARILCEEVRETQLPAGGWKTVGEIIRKGNVIVTTNWDLMVEFYAKHMSVPMRLGWEPNEEYLSVIKLHGSVDWSLKKELRTGASEYVALRQLQNTPRAYSLPIVNEEVVRIQALENMNRNWQLIKAHTTRPHMIVMSQGKSVEMEPIRPMWTGAYSALSRARELQIVGYSIPPDDIEIRALLRAGVARGPEPAQVVVHNPDPSVHMRVRTYVQQSARSEYRPFTVR
jgi:hypothetical protein